MSQILAMGAKDLKLLVRDRIGFMFTFVIPLIMAIFFGTMFSGGGRPNNALPIAWVDEDSTAASQAFAETLEAGAEFEIAPMTRAEATEAVRLGKRVAYVVLPPGFGQAQGRLFGGNPPNLEIGIDPSRQAETGMLQGVLTSYLARGMTTAFRDTASMRREVARGLAAVDTARDLPAEHRAAIRRMLGGVESLTQLDWSFDTTGAERGPGAGGFKPAEFAVSEIARVRRGPRNGFEVSFPQGILWGIASCAFGFALTLVLERMRGTLVRLRVAPVSRSQILAGKAIACFGTIAMVITMLLVIGAVVFKVRPASILHLGMAIVSIGIGYVGLMMLISVTGKTPGAVSGFGWTVMMMMNMFGGGMIPLFLMPSWMQAASNASPAKWAILSLEGAIWRDFTTQQMLLPCAVLVAVGLVGFLGGSRLFRWAEA